MTANQLAISTPPFPGTRPMKFTPPHSPAQKLVNFFKKTSDSDLILAYEDKTTGQTILYSKKSNLLHSLRKFFLATMQRKSRRSKNWLALP